MRVGEKSGFFTPFSPGFFPWFFTPVLGGIVQSQRFQDQIWRRLALGSMVSAGRKP